MGRKFTVGNHPRSSFKVGGKHLVGGTVYDADTVGIALPILETDANVKFSSGKSAKVEPEVKSEVEEPVSEEKQKVYTEDELFVMVKAQQVDLIKSYDDSLSIPSREAGRVTLILKLQEETA